jgi:hypothetical protein
LLPRSKIKRWRRKFGDGLENFRRLLPEALERVRCFPAAAQWARIDRQAIDRLCEGLCRGFRLLQADSIETRIRILAPAGRGTGVSDQIDFGHVLDSMRNLPMAARRSGHSPLIIARRPHHDAAANRFASRTTSHDPLGCLRRIESALPLRTVGLPPDMGMTRTVKLLQQYAKSPETSTSWISLVDSTRC